jgi:4-aminobutyrate aminotransferase-like enzyme
MEPPLLVSEAEIDEGVAILASALEAVAGKESA